ncbi:zinc-binding dehydrogenase [Kribbella sp. NBC_00359]|uniref:zinc-binding dehydrogenase n=1 Tax=Kribbella sp. NBC_00359 TaxID=2975966 RepID=UPI002E230B59
MRLADLPVPDSPACTNAVEVTTAYCSPAIVNHSLRVYFWAAALGTARGVDFDAELLFVAALLHDLGLVEDFDSHRVPFEVAGGSVAWVFAAGAGWPVQRRTRVSEVIVRHMWPDVDPQEDPEGFLMVRSTGFDIVGRGEADFPVSFRNEVLARYPRLSLADEFLTCFQDQATRKPDSSAAAAIRNDLGVRMAANPLEQAPPLNRRTSMYAVRAHARGGPEQLVYEEAPRPDPSAGEVLVAVKAASITPDELTWPERTPFIPSHEFSGVIAALGAGVDDLAVGDAVYGLIPFTRDGAAAEYVALPAGVVVAKPTTVDHDHAAALPLAALTAWQALVRHAGLQAGQRVLVHGGAGGVGSYAVQIAVALGGQVSATASTAQLQFVKDLGAQQVIDYTSERFEDRVADVDVVIDLVGTAVQSRSWPVLRPGGILVSAAAPVDADEAARHGVRGLYFIVEPDRDGLRSIAELVDSGRLVPVLDRVLPLTSTRAGYEALEERGRRGKIVIQVAE